MRGRPFSEASLFFFTESKAVEAVVEGVAVGGGCAVGAVEGAVAVGAPTMGFAEAGAFDGVVIAGVVDGRGGGADCHNGNCTRPEQVKKGTYEVREDSDTSVIDALISR